MSTMLNEAENPLLHSTLPKNTTGQDPSNETQLQRTCQESKKLWQIAGPSIFSRLAMFSTTVVTQSFAGHLSDLDLAAISIGCTVLISITFGFLLGMASALETLCGQAYGARQYQMLGIYLQRSWVVLFLSSLFLLPMFLFAAPILKFIGQPVAVAEQAGLVAIWLIPLHLSFPFQFTLQRFLQSQLKTSVIAWISGGALAIHVLVSWALVCQIRIGVAGSVLIIGFSWWVSVLGMLGYTVFGGCPQSWTGFSSEAFAGLWDFFKLSVASGIMLALENFYYRVLLIVSGFMHNSEIAMDALSVCVTIYGWESMISLGFLAATGLKVNCLKSLRLEHDWSVSAVGESAPKVAYYVILCCTLQVESMSRSISIILVLYTIKLKNIVIIMFSSLILKSISLYGSILLHLMYLKKSKNKNLFEALLLVELAVKLYLLILTRQSEII